MKLTCTVLGLAAALALTSGGYALAQSAAIGIAASVVKEVKLSNAQAPKGKQVVVKQRIALGDLIQTGKASQLQVLLLDRSTFSIGANAALRIDRFVYDPARGRNTGATMTKGAFRFMSGQRSAANSASVTTPVATIGIRGTILDGAVGEIAREIAKGEIKPVKDAKADKKTATLIVLRGPGFRTQAGAEVGAASVTSGGVTIELTGPMQAAYVPKAGAAPIPFRISPAGLAKLRDQIFPRQAAGGGGATAALVGGLLGVLPGVLGDDDNNGGGRQPTGTQSPNNQVPGRP
jgi:FecR protein